MKRVYFARCVGTLGPIKIGCSAAPAPRLKQLGCYVRREIEILAEAPGDFFTEANLHRKFAEFNVAPPFEQTRPYLVGAPTEWFEASPALFDYIATVKSSRRIILKDEERIEVMIARLRQAGRTLQCIGREFGFTRQRAHQILVKLERRAAA